MIHNTTKSRLAVSEPLGYVLLFSVSIIVVVAIIGIGIPNINEDMNNKKVITIEKSFTVLDSNISDLLWKGNEKRKTSMKVYNIQEVEPKSVKLRFANGRQIYSEYTPLKYENTEIEHEVVYENDLVLSFSEETQYAVDTASFRRSEDTAAIPFIKTTVIDTPNQPNERVAITTEKTTSDITEVDVSSQDVFFEIESTNPEVWRQQLSSNSMFSSCSIVAEQVSCEIDSGISTVYIHSATIQVSFN